MGFVMCVSILKYITFMLPCIVIDSFLNNQPDALIIQIYALVKVYNRINVDN